MVQSVVVQHAPIAMHVSPDMHGVSLGGQLRTQPLFWQAWLAPQDLPHAPQLLGSLVRSVQNGCEGPPSTPPGQTVCIPPSPEVHVAEQALFEHRRPMHDWPHLPQLDGSLLVSTHAPLHITLPPVQLPEPSPVPPLLLPLLPPLLLPPLPSPTLPSSPPSPVPS
jgi:hypothetical protein